MSANDKNQLRLNVLAILPMKRGKFEEKDNVSKDWLEKTKWISQVILHSETFGTVVLVVRADVEARFYELLSSDKKSLDVPMPWALRNGFMDGGCFTLNKWVTPTAFSA